MRSGTPTSLIMHDKSINSVRDLRACKLRDIQREIICNQCARGLHRSIEFPTQTLSQRQHCVQTSQSQVRYLNTLQANARHSCKKSPSAIYLRELKIYCEACTGKIGVKLLTSLIDHDDGMEGCTLQTAGRLDILTMNDTLIETVW